MSSLFTGDMSCGNAIRVLLIEFKTCTAGFTVLSWGLIRHLGTVSERQMNVEEDFEVVLAKSGLNLRVAAGQSILEAVEAAGVDAPNSCITGRCGACETRARAGLPDHQDDILTAEERRRNDLMMICCSRSRTPRLVLDL
ncbi:MAG: 2Fe-2S iron-sulfur cluster binding domain-containing protein [Gammaproteobacteria bacterium]|nr:2Fe-2S iron-sulfur cluster binding domain-containing protein [Gammaproteobacteria bacterium]